MLYYIFKYLDQTFDFPGAGLFNYISFRTAMATICSLGISLVFGKKIINFLKSAQIGEEIRDLGLDGQEQKKGTPTMGGILIVLATLVPVFLISDIANIYIILLIVTTLWMGVVGFLDDYIKVFKKNKKGLHGKFKIMGQIGLGIIIGTTLYFHPKITTTTISDDPGLLVEQKSVLTTIPFLKNNEFDYSKIITIVDKDWKDLSWSIFIPVVIFIISAVSNGANLSDGIDGLAAGTSVIIVLTLGIFAWVSGNIIFSNYLNIMYIPNSGEISVYIGAFAGALIGFLWFNAFPAQVFMGDTGSLTIGGVIAVIAIMVRKELLIPIVCGVFLVETLSVMLQVGYFQYTKKRFGQGRRVFLMSPLHHHFQMKKMHESKIVTRFWIVGIILAVISIITLKIR